MSPIILGLLLAIGFSYVTSRQAPRWVCLALATPQSVEPPAIVAAVEQGQTEWAGLLTKKKPKIAKAASAVGPSTS